jgi:hypothetical protein
MKASPQREVPKEVQEITAGIAEVTKLRARACQ